MDLEDIFYLGATQKAGHISDTDSFLQQCLNQKERQRHIHFIGVSLYISGKKYINAGFTQKEVSKAVPSRDVASIWRHA